MDRQVFWRTTAQPRPCRPLSGEEEAQIAVVGGGMAGLSAALHLSEAGCDVMVVEAETCGAGASGHNSGSIIPDAVEDVHQLVRRFGEARGGALAGAAEGAVARIAAIVAGLGIDCDAQGLRGLYAATGHLFARDVHREHAARLAVGLDSRLVEGPDLGALVGAPDYRAGVLYDGALAVNGYELVVGLRDALLRRGVRIFENSRVREVAPGRISCQGGRVRARDVVVCVDRLAPTLGLETRGIHHQQHVITVSEPLDAETRRALFPSERLVVHALDRSYHYWRLTPDNRLVAGGMPLAHAYGAPLADPMPQVQALVGTLRERLPALRGVAFTHGWAGLFGVSRDLLPIAGPVARERGRGLHVALCGGGMAWSLLAGETAARIALGQRTPFADLFGPGRAMTPIDPLVAPLPKSVSFPAAHAYTVTMTRGGPAAVARKRRLAALGFGLAAGAALVFAARRARARRGA